MDWTLRPLRQTDSLDDLTDLLHAAYAASGRRFFASYQSPADTARRVARGQCWVALAGDAIIGTVTTVAPYAFPSGYPAPEPAGTFYQLAVSPTYQHLGLGTLLLERAEALIQERGVSNIAIDTSDQATELIDWYRRHGYRALGTWRWDVTNYDSIVLGKTFPPTARAV